MQYYNKLMISLKSYEVLLFCDILDHYDCYVIEKYIDMVICKPSKGVSKSEAEFRTDAKTGMLLAIIAIKLHFCNTEPFYKILKFMEYGWLDPGVQLLAREILTKVKEFDPLMSSKIPTKVKEFDPLMSSKIPKKVKEFDPLMSSKIPTKVKEFNPLMSSKIPTKVEKFDPLMSSKIPTKVKEFDPLMSSKIPTKVKEFDLLMSSKIPTKVKEFDPLMSSKIFDPLMSSKIPTKVKESDPSMSSGMNMNLICINMLVSARYWYNFIILV